MDSLGGMQAYQASSILGQGKERGGDSSRVLVEWLKEMGEDGLRSDQWGKERKIRWVVGILHLFGLDWGYLKTDDLTRNSPLGAEST